MKIKSMTGYGRGETKGEYSWAVEVKSVNHRFLEIYVRLSRPWLFLEENIKGFVKERVSRGRVDVFVNLSSKTLPARVEIDKALVKNYHSKLMEIKDEIGFDGPITLSLLSLMPDAFCVEETLPKEQELWDSLAPALEEALEELVAMRAREGESLGLDIDMRLEAIEDKLDIIRERADVVPEGHIKRLRQNLERLTPGLAVEQERLDAEIALMAEKSCITEEIIRLSSHIGQLKATISSEGLIGKKMDFIAQEMFREVNTIAAKSSDYEITKQVIDIKSEVEKIREQIQNIE